MFRTVSDEHRSECFTTRVELRTARRFPLLGTRYSVLLAILLIPFFAESAHARVHHSEAWARDRFAAAERMREALNGRPPAERKRGDYQRVLNAYRNVYYGAPTSTKADPSVVAVAEVLVEMGRHFDDDKILNSAIDQYKFLRKEYPGSKYRADALFTIGEIYKDDLNDTDQARATFKEFLHRYPHDRLAEDAQQAIVEMYRDTEAAKIPKNETAKKDIAKAGAPKNESRAEAAKADSPKTKTDKDGNERNTVASSKDSGPAPDTAQATQNGNAADGNTSAQEASASASSHPGRLPRVTGIRHWSTPDYTRVAIDLESDVKFGSQRISNPDRIFFDLRDTKLASTLVGKSFDVDDGFLKKIRVAQFQPGRTRVVLEVDSLSDYEAFLLPDPYRLIIDIHGKDIHGKDEAKNGKSSRLTKEQAAALDDAEAPPKATKPDVPRSEVKADLKALAGKPATKKEEIHDSTSADSNNDNDEEASADTSDAPKTYETTVKTPTGTIKKVIVEADADEHPSRSKKTAKSAGPAKHSSAASEADADKTDNTNDVATVATSAPPADASVSDDKSAGDKSTEDKAKGDTVSASSVRKPARRLGKNSAARGADLEIHEARPTASGDRSLIRALGLKIGKIVIDPGHGGHDTGTIGPNGLEEKDLVLEVGRRLGKLLETRLGAEVVYTRKDDTFIPLETRTAIANKERADLFISIHANSSDDPEARGVETYYLNFTSSPDALEVAARENAVSEKSIYELQDLVKKIALKEKIEESREFAGDVQESLHAGLAAKSPAIRDRGVKKAPFIVLIGANMPSILAEISFVSNPTDERRLETAEYRQKIAESLYRGVAKYVNGLSGVKLASKIDKPAGQ
jgi:N-acetylmuramoyl-L-alanine amidase